jgi:hypothetical protein
LLIPEVAPLLNEWRKEVIRFNIEGEMAFSVVAKSKSPEW